MHIFLTLTYTKSPDGSRRLELQFLDHRVKPSSKLTYSVGRLPPKSPPVYSQWLTFESQDDVWKNPSFPNRGEKKEKGEEKESKRVIVEWSYCSGIVINLSLILMEDDWHKA